MIEYGYQVERWREVKIMIDCAFCDSAAVSLDRDMDMWLCATHYNEMNGRMSIPELDEVW